jgi:hypothetical protein
MSYKSKHTGAQVDEAVSKVLNGDIEGSNIKEGSIPLSALSIEVKNKIENAGGGADWNAKENEAGHILNRTHFTQDTVEAAAENNGDPYSEEYGFIELPFNIDYQYTYNVIVKISHEKNDYSTYTEYEVTLDYVDLNPSNPIREVYKDDSTSIVARVDDSFHPYIGIWSFRGYYHEIISREIKF